jgi:hypothetical protein
LKLNTAAQPNHGISLKDRDFSGHNVFLSWMHLHMDMIWFCRVYILGEVVRSPTVRNIHEFTRINHVDSIHYETSQLSEIIEPQRRTEKVACVSTLIEPHQGNRFQAIAVDHDFLHSMVLGVIINNSRIQSVDSFLEEFI